MAATSRSHRFRISDVRLEGQRHDGDLYSVRLPSGRGTVYVSDRAIDAFGDRLDAAFLTRRLNDFLQDVGAGEAFGCLSRGGIPIELAPDGTIDPG